LIEFGKNLTDVLKMVGKIIKNFVLERFLFGRVAFSLGKVIVVADYFALL
jgi:hypothetical protein